MILTGRYPVRNLSKREYLADLRKWDKIMARRTYRIELKIDFADDDRHEHMLEVAKQYARDFIASAMLLADRGKPDIALITDDSFVGREDIELLESSDNVHT